MVLKNIFFDLDGTLINSEPGLLHAHTHALEQTNCKRGLEILEREGIGWTIGPPLGITVPRLIGSEDAQKIQNYIAVFQQLYRKTYYRDFLLYDGVESLLSALKAPGRKIFVCTSKPELIARQIMDFLGYDTLISGLAGAHLDERPHEKSGLLQALCRQHDCMARESAVVGDRRYDMEAGRHLQFALCIGAGYGFGSEPELRSSGATHIAGRALDVLDILADAQQ